MNEQKPGQESVDEDGIRTVPKRLCTLEQMEEAFRCAKDEARHDDAAKIAQELLLLRPTWPVGGTKEQAVEAYHASQQK